MRKYDKVPGAGGGVTSRRRQVPCGNMTKSQGQGGGVTSRRRQVPCGNMAKSQGHQQGPRSRAEIWQSPRGWGGVGDQQQAPGPVRKYGKVPGAGVGWVTSSRPQVPCGNMTKSQGLGGDQFQSVKTGWG